MIAYCGLDCSVCDAYLATREDDDSKKQRAAQTWSEMYRAEIAPEHINCDGCKSDGVKFFHCDSYDIRRCAMSRNVEHCAACENYICDALSRFIELAPQAGAALEALRT